MTSALPPFARLAVRCTLVVSAVLVVLLLVTVALVDPVSAVELTQDTGGGQEVADDGTRPLRLLAVLMGLLALLLGAFTRWYWKATTPPARRGYLPDQQSSPLP